MADRDGIPVHVDVGEAVGLGGRLLGPAVDHPGQVELGIPHRSHLPVDDGGQGGRRSVLVHHIGELVVAVHEPGDEVDRTVLAQPRRGHVEAGKFPTLDALEERRPPVDLALVEALGMAEALESPGLPVDLRQQGDARRPTGRPGPAGPRDRWRRARATRRCSSATTRRRTPSDRTHARGPKASSQAATARVWGTSVPSRAAMIDHSRRIPASRVSGADGGGMRRAQCNGPRRIS